MERLVAVFALGPVHDPYDEQEGQDSRAQLDIELAKFPWFKPIALEMFAVSTTQPSYAPFHLVCWKRAGKRFAGLDSDPRLGKGQGREA